MDNKKWRRKVFWLTTIIGFGVSLIFLFVGYPIIAYYCEWGGPWNCKPFLGFLLYKLLHKLFPYDYASFGLFSNFRAVPFPIYDAFLSILIFALFIILGIVLSKVLPPPNQKETKTFEDINLF